LSLPNKAAHAGNEDEILEKDDPKFNDEWAALGQNLQDIHDIVNKRQL
jgi:hypothetical protein